MKTSASILVHRVDIPVCTSCKRHGIVSRECILCGGTGYFAGCDNCDHEMHLQSEPVYLVDSRERSYYLCGAVECRASAYEDLHPASSREYRRSA